jgi:hypothetical protein
LQKEFFLQAQAFLARSNSIPFPQHDPPIHKHLFHNLTLGHVGEYSRVAHVLAPFFFAPKSVNTTLALTTLHPELDGYFSFFFKGYEPNQDLELSSNSLKLAFQCMLHLSTNGPSGMVFEHFRNCFHLEDSVSGFPQLF